MEIKHVQCKTALSASSLPGLSYSLNPYRGCQHGCAYCYAPSVLRMPRDSWNLKIEVKTNIASVLAKELRTKKPGVVGISTVTDPYQPLEQNYRLTRFCLEQLVQYDLPAHIQTKSALVTRDIDLISRFSDSQVMVSVGTLNDWERMALEPCSSSIQERLAAVRKFTDIGVRTAVFFGPIYPTIGLNDIPSILDCFKESGASEIWIDRLNLKPGIQENIQKKLTQDQELSQIFTKIMCGNTDYYTNIRAEIRKKAKERNLKIIDAF